MFSSSWRLAAITGVTTFILLLLVVVLACKPSNQDWQTVYDNDMQILFLFFVSFVCSLTTIIAASNTNICSNFGCKNAMGIGFQYSCCVAIAVIGLSWLIHSFIKMEEGKCVALELMPTSSALEMDPMDSYVSNNDTTDVLTATVVSTSPSHRMCPDKGHVLDTIFDKSGYQIVHSDTTDLSS